MVPSSLGVPWPPTKFFVLRTIVPRINRSHRVSIDWGTVSGIMGHNNCSWVPSRSPLGRHLSPVGLLDVTVQKARWLRARSSTSRDHLRSKSLNFILSLAVCGTSSYLEGMRHINLQHTLVNYLMFSECTFGLKIILKVKYVTWWNNFDRPTWPKIWQLKIVPILSFQLRDYTVNPSPFTVCITWGYL
jgi:hypothetical protein